MSEIIKFLTSDKQTVDVPVEIANLFDNINSIENNSNISVPNISSKVLFEIIQFAQLYAEKHSPVNVSGDNNINDNQNQQGIESLKEWENDYFKNLCIKGDIKFKLMLDVMDKARILGFSACQHMLTEQLFKLIVSMGGDKINEIFENCDPTDDQKMVLLASILEKPFNDLFINETRDVVAANMDEST